MKRFSLPIGLKARFRRIADIKRRQGWFIDNLTVRKAANMILATSEYLLKREKMRAWPVVVKVDISPVCNLRCTICVHARPGETSSEGLKDQSFKADQKMALAQFQRIVDEVAGKTSSISMYYLGDPLVHPELDAMCRYTASKGLNSHISTNFSFDLSDERIDSIVRSGMTHLTVCVDGLSQEKYQRTRVGGRINVVLENLERLVKRRKELGREFPKVEVQYIKFQHNVDELEEATKRFWAIGVDQVTDYWGGLFNYTDLVAGKHFKVHRPKKNKLTPQCLWPHFSLLIKFNGDVIPCCNYRHTPQYGSTGEDQRTVGNVLQTSVWDVWNSAEYQALRRFASNPELAATEQGLASTFCDGCPSLFETDVDKIFYKADEHKWEDHFEQDERKRVRRKQTSEPQLVGGTASLVQLERRVKETVG